MAKLALLLPYQEIVDIAEDVIRGRDDIVCNRLIQNAAAVSEARKAVEAGAEIIIARGRQAQLIKEHIGVPVVELRIHTQEIGVLLKKARAMLRCDNPQIGLIPYKNMVCDLSGIDELFEVRLLISDIEKEEQAMARVNELASEGAELFIGGHAVCQAANTLGYPALIYQTSRESMKEALREADRMAYAMETERRNEVQLETVMGTGFNGIIKINTESRIIVLNRLAVELAGKKHEDMIGLSLYEVFPDFDRTMVDKVLHGRADSYTASVNLVGRPWILLISPLQYRDKITGAILSLYRQDGSGTTAYSIRRDIANSGFQARHAFRDIHTSDAAMNEQLSLARQYALSGSPVIIYTETGTEAPVIAEAIHYNSGRTNSQFVIVDAGMLRPHDQMDAIFGETAFLERKTEDWTRSAAARASEGTLFIKGIEYTTREVQNHLAGLLRYSDRNAPDIRTLDDTSDIRLIVTAGCNLRQLVHSNSFSSELFYCLQGLVLEIPPLRARHEDLMWYFDKYFREYCRKYSRYLVPTSGALKMIESYEWEGNIIQLRSFCERLVLTGTKRSIDEIRVQKLYDGLYPSAGKQESLEEAAVYKRPEAAEIEELLKEHHGNRQKVALELGISTTTLWRRMKKYGLEV